MHDLARSDLKEELRQLHAGTPGDEYAQADVPAIRAAITTLEARKRLGLDRYQSLLQAGNGRDCLRDLLEEIADGVVYARQWLAETGCHAAFEAYTGLLRQLVAVQAAIIARDGRT
jgi:hypothetical protein